MKNPIQWIRRKSWFFFDLPCFIKERGYQNGLELGAKAGRSMYHMLRVNPRLHLTGIDLWEVIEGGAYTKNGENEEKCRHRLRKFKDRMTLIKGNALNLCEEIEDRSLDFVYYDLQCKPMQGFHRSVLEKYLPKIKKGGVMIGRDFRGFRNDFYGLGFEESDFIPCEFNNRISHRLEYLYIS